ncbi:MAG: S-layer protein [Candidatus Micrarchaeia archaeon]
MFLAPTGATATTAGGENTYQEVVPIKVGAAVLDSQISDIWAQNLIVVGGPCANKVAAQLMGNPTVCNAGFEPGKAFIRLYEQNGKVAILVAGYEGEDTLRASRVLADYKKYGLSGTSVEVTGTSLTDITVSKPQ